MLLWLYATTAAEVTALPHHQSITAVSYVEYSHELRKQFSDSRKSVYQAGRVLKTGFGDDVDTAMHEIINRIGIFSMSENAVIKAFGGYLKKACFVFPGEDFSTSWSPWAPIKKMVKSVIEVSFDKFLQEHKESLDDHCRTFLLKLLEKNEHGLRTNPYINLICSIEDSDKYKEFFNIDYAMSKKKSPTLSPTTMRPMLDPQNAVPGLPLIRSVDDCLWHGGDTPESATVKQKGGRFSIGSDGDTSVSRRLEEGGHSPKILRRTSSWDGQEYTLPILRNLIKVTA